MSKSGDILFAVENAVFERFPDYIVGCVYACGLDLGRRNQVILDLLADAGTRARITYGNGDLKDYREIAVWRSAFSSAGWSASRFPASVEAIIKRVVRGADLPRINDAVDLANAAALYYGVPIGVHDSSSFLDGPLVVRESHEGDSFQPLGDGESETPDPRELVYAVGSDVRTRRWVWRQSRTALVTDQATSVFFPIDGFSGVTDSRVQAATEFIVSICRDTLDATVQTGWVSATSRQFPSTAS